MPTYEFRCPQGHEFERFYRSISGAEAQAACPVCGELAERLMSVSGFAFKGSGFYLTDYGKNAHREKGVEPRKQPSESAPSGESSGTEPAKADGAAAAPKGETAKSEAKSDAKSDGASRGDAASGSPAKASARSDAKPDGAKPAAAPKKSTGE